ncbi:MAG: MarR family winged helix-turn-helix transcriptional regulator [Clostridia bacterium]|nr:MarR family winged helix-turn-helix transcriptional regulator [Clostridia bacterium]
MEKPLMMTVKDTYKKWREYMKSLALEAGIPESYRMALTFLLRYPGASQKDLAEFRNITTASVSQIVKDMEATGYLRKEINEKDQRYVNLYLTEKGEACAEELHQRLVKADEKITELFTPEKEKEMISLLHELSDIIEKELPKC